MKKAGMCGPIKLLALLAPLHDIMEIQVDITAETLSLFPSMKYLPQDCINAAAYIASGKTPRKEGFKVIGRGSFVKAWSNKHFVVKGADLQNDEVDNMPAENYREWLNLTREARQTSTTFRKVASTLLTPTVVLFDTVAVQQKTALRADKLHDRMDGGREFWKISDTVDKLALLLGITDIHTENWGLDDYGNVQVFDIMPYNSSLFDPKITPRLERKIRRLYGKINKALAMAGWRPVN